jgi:hypothetical protein
MNELKQFDQLVADISSFVAPTLTIQVTDHESNEGAVEAVRGIKGLLAAVEKKRKELVGPLNEQVKAINDYCKRITEPLNRAETTVRMQINEFAAVQERARRAEEERLRKEREEEERRAAEEKARLEAEILARQQAEVEEHAEAANLFGPDSGDIEAVHSEIAEEHANELATATAQLEMQAAVRAIEHKQKEFDVQQMGVKHTRKTLKMRVVDINLIPKEFLIIQPNEKAILAAAKAGVKIDGVEFYEDIQVAIGSASWKRGKIG